MIAVSNRFLAAVDSYLGPCSRCVRSHEAPHHQSSACHMMPSGQAGGHTQRKKKDAQEGTCEQNCTFLKKGMLTKTLMHKHSCLIALYNVKKKPTEHLQHVIDE